MNSPSCSESAVRSPSAICDQERLRPAGVETGWLIERESDDGLRYSTGTTWDRDASKGLRFARRQDAETFVAAFLNSHFTSVREPTPRVAEHSWS